MRVIEAPVLHSRPDVRRTRTMKLEFLALAASTLVVSCGILLAMLAKSAGASESGLRLNALESPAQLEPVLSVFDSPHERQVAALTLYRHVSGRAVEHVGGLAAAMVPAEQLRSDARLTRLRARLDRRPGAAAIAVLSSADLAVIKPRLTVRTAAEFRSRTTRAIALMIAAFWAAHLVRWWRKRDDDPVLLPTVLLLCGVGAMAMLGLRDPLRDTLSAATFAGGAAVGVLLLLAASEIDFESSPLRRAVLLPLGAALGLAVMLLLFGSGPGSSGVKVNLFGAQPVEVIRLLVVFALASYFSRRLELLRALSEPVRPERRWLRVFRFPRWKDVRPVLVSMSLVLAFFFFQKDLGPALVLACVFLAMYGIGRGHAAFVATGLAMLVFAFAAAYWLGYPATVRQRVAIWAAPWNNGVPGGNQVAHGLWALGTGAMWGSGPGLGSPGEIPAGHTDFVLAAIGEELGFAGLSVVLLLYALVAWRCLRTATRAPGDYSAFLCVGVALVLGVQALVIGGGLLGLIPLSGVVTPFLSYGRSSMFANCLAVGIVLAAAQRRGGPRLHLVGPVKALGGVLALALVAVGGRAAWIQVVHADAFAAAASVSEQADGGYRFEHNPRLLAAARSLPRGTIYDRNGLPLASSRPDEIAAMPALYKAAGVAAVQACGDTEARCYPLGGVTFHMLGDWTHQVNWGARNSSYVERDRDAQLKGYDDAARTIDVVNPRTGERHAAISRDYRALLPLVRQQHWPTSAAIDRLRARNRDLHTSIDARLQMRTADALRKRIVAQGDARGAAVVLDAGSGEVLASVSYPWPSAVDVRSPAVSDEAAAADGWLDRARYGLYPPGSVFKILVAGAALRGGASDETFGCVRLPDGRVGHGIRGTARPVRDDPKDTVPHGAVGLHAGLVVSCNAYFAQLAQRLGPQPIVDAAALFQIDVARPSTPEGLVPTLAHAGYGQGQVVTTPVKMARLSAAIANRGVVSPLRWVSTKSAAAEPATPAAEQRFLSGAQAAIVGRAMRMVVTEGTGRALREVPVPIAGKTGTAEIAGAPAHSWFTGFAPFGSDARRIAFAVVVENAGYGARAAAPIAGEVVTAARELGVIK